MALPLLPHLASLLRRVQPLDVWYDPRYRLPLSGVGSDGTIELRRADLVAWYLAQAKVLSAQRLHAPRRISWEALARVHDERYLETLADPDTLARIFATDASDVPVDELMESVRLGCGGTLEAARSALRTRRPALNLHGGFHHAAPSRGGGFCALNDVAVAIAALRAEGFQEKVAIVDVDAHPPEGTWACIRSDPLVWLGSLSACDWGPLEGADETVLPKGTRDDVYLAALDALLRRMPRAGLAFVVAGGDVLAGDTLGLFSLSLRGARQRDERIAAALQFTPSVWLPGGGYHRASWRILAGTALVLAGRGGQRIPRRYDPLRARFEQIASEIPLPALGVKEQAWITPEEIDELFGGRARQFRFLGFYSAQGIEFALHRYGFLSQLEQLGYHQVRVELDHTANGDRIRVWGDAEGKIHLLVEVVLDRRTIAGRPFLFVNWLTLRNPRAHFTERRPALPGQEVPGLSMAREAGELLLVMAKRLSLAGVAFRPAWFHMAYAGRYHFRFVDPARQGRFEAMVRDFAAVPLVEITQAMHEGRVRLNGAPYAWEPEDMVFRSDGPVPEGEAEAIADAREGSRFSIVPAAA